MANAKTAKNKDLKVGHTVWMELTISRGLAPIECIPCMVRNTSNSGIKHTKSLGEKRLFKSRRVCLTRCKEMQRLYRQYNCASIERLPLNSYKHYK